ncbi:MAG: hypothetical protein M3372_03890 [Verrucomicrobiota bacterium]|nr:hypothetical protein [Verrucomicrobiota bacterium]
MPDGDGKPEPPQIDPAKLEQLLEIELMQKRAAWQQAKAKRGNLRALSFMFLFLVIIGALLAFFFVFSSGTLSELRPGRSDGSPTPTASPE